MFSFHSLRAAMLCYPVNHLHVLHLFNGIFLFIPRTRQNIRFLSVIGFDSLFRCVGNNNDSFVFPLRIHEGKDPSIKCFSHAITFNTIQMHRSREKSDGNLLFNLRRLWRLLTPRAGDSTFLTMMTIKAEICWWWRKINR